jgi:hypothetical protein
VGNDVVQESIQRVWNPLRLYVNHDPDSLSSGGQTNRRKQPTNLFNPDILAREIVDDLENSLEQFRPIAID